VKDGFQIPRLFLVGRKNKTGGRKERLRRNKQEEEQVCWGDGKSDLNMVYLRFLQDTQVEQTWQALR